MKTAMQQMLDELMAHEYTIPIGLIVKCKELIEVEKKQIINADLNATIRTAKGALADVSVRRVKELGEQYYNKTYTNGL